MTARAIALLAVAAALSAPQDAARPCDASPLLIRNATIWTPSGMLSRRDVVIREGRVQAIAASGSSRNSRMRTIDASGHTLLPGLIDAHLHFVVPGGLPGGAQRTDAAEITGRQLLRSGVTSGRLHLATLEEAIQLKARSAAACSPMPRLQAGGPALSGASDRDAGNFQGAASPEAAAAKLERFRAAGLEWVAIHNADRFSADVLGAIRDTARRVGLRLMAAGATPAEITAALALDPGTLDYFDRTTEPLYGAPLLGQIATRPDLVLVPTPGVPYRTAAYARSPSTLDAAVNVEFLAEADRRFVLDAARAHVAGPEGESATRVMRSLPGKFLQLQKLGLRMAIGSDSGSPLHFQPNAIWWELEAWRSLGASHREALTAATENGARVLAWDDVGRLGVGARGDFVLYRGNVESGPFDSARVIAVGKDGVLFVDAGKWLGS